MYLTLSICVLFISLMQSVNGEQFLNSNFLSLLLGFAAGVFPDLLIFCMDDQYFVASLDYVILFHL